MNKGAGGNEEGGGHLTGTPIKQAVGGVEVGVVVVVGNSGFRYANT